MCNKPKVIIEESITSTIKTGVGKHTITLNNMISELGVDYEIISNKLIEKTTNPILKRIFYIIYLNTIFVWKLLFAKKGTVAIYTSFLPFIKFRKITQIAIIHDILAQISPQNMTKTNVINNKLINFLIKNNADRILTVSNTVKKEIVDYLNIDESKIYTVYNSFSLSDKNTIEDSLVFSKYNLKKSKYILSISSLNKNKNIENLVRAFEIVSKDYPDIKLVLTGGKPDVLKSYENITSNKNIIFTGYLSDIDLISLYKSSLFYVFPSIYEGFGIPIIDAQLLNIPVLCSDIPVFREVGEDSVLYMQPDIEGISNSIKVMLNNQELRKELAAKGRKNSKRFEKAVLLEQLKILIRG